MTDEISIVSIEEINRLHNEILSHARRSLDNAIRIGELLTLSKSVIKHGEWLEFVASNIPFDARTAQRYMSVYDRRDQLKNDSVSNLGEAYALLASSNHRRSGAAQLHLSNFYSCSIKLTQSLMGDINQELKDHPLEAWRKDQLVSMAAAIEPIAELYGRIKALL